MMVRGFWVRFGVCACACVCVRVCVRFLLACVGVGVTGTGAVLIYSHFVLFTPPPLSRVVMFPVKNT